MSKADASGPTVLPTTIDDVSDLTPLLVTADALLLADVQRLAAAAGATPVIAEDVESALARWSSSTLVLVGQDLALPLVTAMPERRDGVHLVAREPVLADPYREALALGAETVSTLPEAADRLVALLAEADEGGSGPAGTVGLVPGSGGAGASVFASALALALAGQAPTVLVDADPLGAGLDRILGMERSSGIRWDALLQASGRLSGRALREALPRAGDLRVLTWPARPDAALDGPAAREVLAAGRRGFAHVVLDAPRHLDPVTRDLLGRCDRLVVVSTLTVPALAAATRVVDHLPEGPDRGLVVRVGRGGVSAQAAARVLGLPLLAHMTDQRGLDESVDLGAGPVRSSRGPLPAAARDVARWVRADSRAGRTWGAA